MIGYMNPNEFADIRKALHSGAPISDKELENAIEIFQIILAYIEVLGDKFSLFYGELNCEYRQLLNFQESRKEKKT